MTSWTLQQIFFLIYNFAGFFKNIKYKSFKHKDSCAKIVLSTFCGKTS